MDQRIALGRDHHLTQLFQVGDDLRHHLLTDAAAVVVPALAPVDLRRHGRRLEHGGDLTKYQRFDSAAGRRGIGQLRMFRLVSSLQMQ